MFKAIGVLVILLAFGIYILFPSTIGLCISITLLGGYSMIEFLKADKRGRVIRAVFYSMILVALIVLFYVKN